MRYLFISLFCMASALSLFGTVDEYEAIQMKENVEWLRRKDQMNCPNNVGKSDAELRAEAVAWNLIREQIKNYRATKQSVSPIIAKFLINQN